MLVENFKTGGISDCGLVLVNKTTGSGGKKRTTKEGSMLLSSRTRVNGFLTGCVAGGVMYFYVQVPNEHSDFSAQKYKSACGRGNVILGELDVQVYSTSCSENFS